MSTFLALDAGGTQTRAALVDPDGLILGFGRAGSGNPTSGGEVAAARAVADAGRRALTVRSAVLPPARPSLAVVAMAGEQTPSYLGQLQPRLAELGVQRVQLAGDLLGIFHSGTTDLDGYTLICGTGANAARVRGGEIERVVDGSGWLLGDVGSGYWIGHRVARAATAALDGSGPQTALTELLLADVGIALPGDGWPSRREALRRLVVLLYSWRPVQLSRFSPLAFAAVVEDDAVAVGVLTEAAAALAGLLHTLRADDIPGPVIGGGGVLRNGFLAAPSALQDRIGLAPELRGLTSVTDGLVGAIVLGLRELGVEVDDTLFAGLGPAVNRAAGLS